MTQEIVGSNSRLLLRRSFFCKLFFPLVLVPMLISFVLDDLSFLELLSSHAQDETVKSSGNASTSFPTSSAQELDFPPANPRNRRILGLYSNDLRQKLMTTFQNRAQQRQDFVILANGGSTTAGAGVMRQDLFTVKFADLLKTNYKLKARIVHMGHGNRDSFHSFLLADSFFQPNIDLIIWEFSMNDHIVRTDWHPSQEARNVLLYWLTQVRRYYNGTPPPVLLVYFWSSPLKLNRNGKIASYVFNAHQGLASTFDFVLGHVNVGPYFDSFNYTNQTKVFLADDHHPNALGHAIAARLMLQLVEDTTLEQIKLNEQQLAAPLTWNCLAETREQLLLKKLLYDQRRFPRASFTAALPCNEPGPHNRVLLPMFRPANNNATGQYFWRTVAIGKTSPNRIDRQRGLVLPHCKTEGRLVFSVPNISVLGLQFLLMGMTDEGNASDEAAPVYNRHRRLDAETLLHAFSILGAINAAISIWVDDEDCSDNIFDTEDFMCYFSTAHFRQWMILDEPKNASRIEICSNADNGNLSISLEWLAIL